MLTKATMIKEVAARTSKTVKEVTAVMSALKEVINNSIAKKEKISWKGFFTTSYVQIKERMCKLPKAVAAGTGLTPAHEKMTAKFTVAKKVEHAEINSSRKVQKTA